MEAIGASVTHSCAAAVSYTDLIRSHTHTHTHSPLLIRQLHRQYVRKDRKMKWLDYKTGSK